jgi:hypothetical protein
MSENERLDEGRNVVVLPVKEQAEETQGLDLQELVDELAEVLF